MAKIKKTDSKKEIFRKIFSGKATIENPYAKPLLELWDVIGFLKRNNQPIPKLLEELTEEIHKKNLSYDPLKKLKKETRHSSQP